MPADGCLADERGVGLSRSRRGVAHKGGGVGQSDGLSAGPATGRRWGDGARRPSDAGVSGAGAWAPASRPRRIPTMPVRSLSPRCTHRCRRSFAVLTMSRCVACWPSAIPMWLAGGPSSAVAYMPLVAELVPGGIGKEVVVNQARSLLDSIRPSDVAAIERHRQAVEFVADIERLDAAVRDSWTRITAAVAASGATVTDIFGVGPIVAAMLIGYCGDPLRFASASRYAAYTGTVPTVFSSAAASPIASHGAASGGSTTPCTARRSCRSVIATAPAVTIPTASSPRATPTRSDPHPTSADSATSSGGTPSPTPGGPLPRHRRARAGHWTLGVRTEAQR